MSTTAPDNKGGEGKDTLEVVRTVQRIMGLRDLEGCRHCPNQSQFLYGIRAERA